MKTGTVNEDDELRKKERIRERMAGEYDRIEELKFKGGLFESETSLSLFSGDKNYSPRYTLVYGRNGSGKSTIARAIGKAVGKEVKQIGSAEFTDKNGNNIVISDEGKKATYVFNEDFIDANIRISDEGLEAIIVMGAVKDADDKIKALLPEYEKRQKAFLAQGEVLDNYCKTSSPSCPEYYINEMVSALKGDTNWAGRDARIFNKRTNSAVRGDTYKQFLGLHPIETRDELIVRYSSLFNKLTEARNGSKRIERKVPEIEKLLDVEEKIIYLLAEKIEEPILSEREKNIFKLLQEPNGNKRLAEMKTFFASEGKKVCPFCFQDVTADYSTELIISIEKLLNKKVEEHQNALGKLYYKKIELNLDDFSMLPGNAFNTVEQKLEAYNGCVELVNELIQKKIENVYVPIKIDKIDMLLHFNEVVDALENLEEARIEYNKTATDTKELEEKLKQVNSDIAYYDIAESAKKYRSMIAEKEAETIKYNKFKVARDEIGQEIEKLELEKKNAKIAMDLINDDLAYIFFSKNRLRIEFKDDKYVLFAHEKPVQPSNVSVGERNAIGLCYFFNSIMENRDEGEMYKKPYFLTIDDPVSSFDTENRIGILSYLKYKLGQLSIGNKDSRFLIMTHDLQTLFDTKHLVDEILKKMLETHKNMPGKPKDYLYLYELKNLNLEKIANIVDRSEYTTLFEVIFNYADRAEPAYNSSIGNIMRKVTEAFGTFVYKKGIDDLSIDEKIVSTLSPREKAYFGNLMYRLVLNSGSHMKERVETINDMNFFDFISDADKKRTARDLICFLYKLNPLHVLAHLKSIENAESVIKQWCSEIDS